MDIEDFVVLLVLQGSLMCLKDVLMECCQNCLKDFTIFLRKLIIND